MECRRRKGERAKIIDASNCINVFTLSKNREAKCGQKIMKKSVFRFLCNNIYLEFPLRHLTSARTTLRWPFPAAAAAAHTTACHKVLRVRMVGSTDRVVRSGGRGKGRWALTATSV